MHLDPWTLALQAVNFLVLVWLLRRLLYQPVTAMVAQRQALVAKDFAEAKAARDQAEQARLEIARRLDGIAGERQQQMAAARLEIEAERRQALERTAAEAAAAAEAQRRSLEEDRRVVAAALGDHVVDLAVDLAGRLLAPLGTPVVAAAMLDVLCQRLAALPPERLGSLGDSVEIATMPALDAPAQGMWRERLTGLLGPEIAMDFLADDSLVTGAELRFAGMIVGFSWRDGLAQAKTAMTVAI
ncbi:MAG: hypothetical protein GC191_10365 [Azospirillum sp.]|nr:hypothetical protein [Azospirillum sp.]